MDYFTLCSHAQVAIRVVTPEDTIVLSRVLAASNQAYAFCRSIVSIDPCKMAQFVRERAVSEPHTGKCDAILVTPISNPLLVDERDSDRVGAEAYGLVRHPQPKHQKSHRSSSELLHPSLAAAPVLLSSPAEALTSNENSENLAQNGTPVGKFTVTPQQLKLLHNPLQFPCIESRSIIATENPNVSEVSVIRSDDLLLPCMLVEYKKFSDSETKALNQARTYCVSALSFLAAIGIEGHLIFCLITSGKIGGVMLAWHSKIEDVCIYFHFSVQSSNLAVLRRKSTSWSVTSVLSTCPARSKHSSLQRSWLGFVNMTSASRNYFTSKGTSPPRMPKR
jgi:hypothetical protein